MLLGRLRDFYTNMYKGVKTTKSFCVRTERRIILCKTLLSRTHAGSARAGKKFSLLCTPELFICEREVLDRTNTEGLHPGRGPRGGGCEADGAPGGTGSRPGAVGGPDSPRDRRLPLAVVPRISVGEGSAAADAESHLRGTKSQYKVFLPNLYRGALYGALWVL